MGLDFSGVPDRSGVAIYFLHDGSVSQQREGERLVKDLQAKQLRHQVMVLSTRSAEGEKVRDFYDLSTLHFPHIIVVSDNDQILASWSGHPIPAADMIAHTARSVGEG